MRFNIIVFVFLTLLTILSFSLGLGKSFLHTQDLNFGSAIYSGHLYKTPGYPMWGYPLILEIVGDGVLFLQLIALGVILPFMISDVAALFTGTDPRRTLFAKLLFVVMLIPWFHLSLMYSSSAAYSLMLIASYITLVKIKGEPQNIKWYALAGLLLGLAYNFRTEALITGLFTAAAMCLVFLRNGFSRQLIKPFMAFVSVFFVCLVPYLVYTAYVLGTPRLTTTNGGAVLYDQLGVLPNNPWKIYPSDQFAGEQARTFTDQGPWSLEADREFKKRFFKAIADHPAAFIKRVIMGLKENFSMGLTLPRIEDLFAMNEQDGMKVYLARQQLKKMIWLRPNPYEIERAAKMGITMDDVRNSDRILIAIEFVARLVYVLLWIMLSGLWLVGIFRKGLLSWESLLTSAFLGSMFITSMFVQSGMRSTTSLLPVAALFAFQTFVTFTYKSNKPESCNCPS